MNLKTKSFKMGGVYLLSFVFALVFLGFNACKKDTFLAPVAHDTQVSLSAMDRDGEGGGNNEEKAAIAQHLQGIQDFRAKVGGWRTTPTSETMPASEVVEKTEIAFNYNLGDITSVFESYATAETKISVSATSATWSSTAIASFYDAVKSEVKTQLEAGSGRTLRLMQLGIPTLKGNSCEVDVFIMTGINKLSGPPPTISSVSTRWAISPDGWTSLTSCEGAANEDIGASANNQIGFYQPINAGPGSGGNTLLPGKIVSFIRRGDHNFFGANFPSGSNFPLAFPAVSTFGTSKQALYYNSVSIVPADPPLNCLSNFQLINFAFGNIKIGNSMLSVVPKQNIGGILFSRSLVCTAVGTFFAQADPPGGSPGTPKIKYQEHPTRHFYAVVGQIDTPSYVCCVDYM